MRLVLAAGEQMVSATSGERALKWYAAWLALVGPAEGAAAAAHYANNVFSTPEAAAAAWAAVPVLRGAGWARLVGSGGDGAEGWRELLDNIDVARAMIDSYRLSAGNGQPKLDLSDFDALVAEIRSGDAGRATAAAVVLRDAWPRALLGHWDDVRNPQLTATDHTNGVGGYVLARRGLLAPAGTTWVNLGFEPGEDGWIQPGIENHRQGDAFARVFRRADVGDRRRALLAAGIAAVGVGVADDVRDLELKLSSVPPDPTLQRLLAPLFAPQPDNPANAEALQLESALGVPPYTIEIGAEDLRHIDAATDVLRRILGAPVSREPVAAYIRAHHGEPALRVANAPSAKSIQCVVQLGGPPTPTDIEWSQVADIRPGTVFAHIGDQPIKFPKLPLNGFAFAAEAGIDVGPDRTVGGGLLGDFVGTWAGRTDPASRLAASIAADMWNLQHHGVINIADALRTPAAAAVAGNHHTTNIADGIISSLRPTETKAQATMHMLGRPTPERSAGGIILNSPAGEGSVRWEGGIGRVATPVYTDHKFNTYTGWIGGSRYRDLLKNSRVGRAEALSRIAELMQKYDQHHLEFKPGLLPDWEYVNGPDWVRTHFDTWMQLRYDRYLSSSMVEATRGAVRLGKTLNPLALHNQILTDGLVKTGLEQLRLYAAARMAGAADFEAYSGMAEPKVPEVFNLEHEISAGHIRFRVLRDGDVQHFTVGMETNCCQIVGGAGEDAAIQSYVNSHAGILLLEANLGGQWTLVAQSYFHWVPGDNPHYILDNVEHNAAAVKHLESIFKTDLRSLYAILVSELRAKMPHVSGFVAGSDFSKIGDHTSWATHSQPRDPRRYLDVDRDDEDPEPAASSDHDEFPGYSDYDPEHGLDLTNPKFNVRRPQIPTKPGSADN